MECTPAKLIWKLLAFIFKKKKRFGKENLNETSNLVNHPSRGRLLAMSHKVTLPNGKYKLTLDLKS